MNRGVAFVFGALFSFVAIVVAPITIDRLRAHEYGLAVCSALFWAWTVALAAAFLGQALRGFRATLANTTIAFLGVTGRDGDRERPAFLDRPVALVIVAVLFFLSLGAGAAAKLVALTGGAR